MHLRFLPEITIMSKNTDKLNNTNKSCVIFDCFQTLIYKSGISAVIQEFIKTNFNTSINKENIDRALEIMYERHKYADRDFASSSNREKYYISYNRELLALLGLRITKKLALSLNKNIDKSTRYEIYDDVIVTLDLLKKRKISIGVLANWTKNLKNVISKTGLGEYFGFVYSSSDSNYSKPDPKIYHDLLGKIIPKYTKVYYVGDDYELDVISSKEAGLTPVLIDRLKKAGNIKDCIKINDLKELLKYI